MLTRSFLIGALVLAAPAALAQTMAPHSTMAQHSTMAPHTTATTPTAPTTTAPSRSTSSTASSGGVTQYSSATEATARCAGDTVVWANAKSKALHLSGDRHYGNTKKGFYACEKDALAGGYHLSGQKKHTAKSA